MDDTLTLNETNLECILDLIFFFFLDLQACIELDQARAISINNIESVVII